MDEQSYDNQEITEYLLGSLPAAEAERFDELSFTDERFADALDAAENELLDRYARGELGEDALAQFKSYYLASPLRREKARFAETFQIYGKQNVGEKVEAPVFAEAPPENASGGFFRFSNFLKNPNARRLSFAFAALLLSIAGGFWILKNQSESETARQNATSNVQPEQAKQIEEKQSADSNKEIARVNSANESAAPLPENATPKKNSNARPAWTAEPEKPIAPPKTVVAAFVLSPSMRGDGQIERFSIAKQTTDIDMRLELEADDFPVYLVALTDETGSVKLWHSGEIKATGKGENKFLNIRFPARLLKSKIYSLVVSGVKSGAGAEVISNYSFRSVLK